MSIEKQFEFAERQLRLSAESVDIDLDASEGGLVVIHDALDGWQQDFSDCPEYHAEAERLWAAHGDSPEGREVLRAIGEACALAADTWIFRNWEDQNLSFEDQGWDSLKSRTFVDYAFSVGIAATRCAEYANRGGGDAETTLAAARREGVRMLASKAAFARHAENREIAERIQSWYAENRHLYRSMDQAAEAVVKLEPVAWRTARKHIGAAAKNLPSARKE